MLRSLMAGEDSGKLEGQMQGNFILCCSLQYSHAFFVCVTFQQE